MKRLFLYIILLAAQLTCLAQTNPKIDSLYANLKAKGIAKTYILRNNEKGGLRKEFNIFLQLYDDNPSPILYQGKTFNAKSDSMIRAKWANERYAYNLIRKTLAELADDAAEYYSYEYHQNGADTIITTIALKNRANSDSSIRKYKNQGNNMNVVFFAPEFVSFNYKNTSPKVASTNRQIPIGYGNFTYNGIVDSTLLGTKDFNVKKFMKDISPILKDKTIKKRTMFCKHDPDFNLRTYLATVPAERRFLSTSTIDGAPGGESNYTILKFTSERKAREVLRQITDCARRHIAENPNETYSICSEDVFSPSHTTVFGGYDHYNETSQYSKFATDCVEITTEVIKNSFYIFINVFKGENYLPCDFLKIKSFINDKIEYYDDEL